MTTMTTADLDEIRPVTEYLRTIPHELRRDSFNELANQLPVRVFTRVKRSHMVSQGLFIIKRHWSSPFVVSLSNHERTVL